MSDVVFVRCFASGSSHYQTGQLHAHTTGALLLTVGTTSDILPIATLTISDQLGDIARTIHLPDGRMLEVTDNSGLNALLARSGTRPAGLVFWLEQHWLGAAASVLLAVIAVYVLISDGIPLTAKWVAFSLPAGVDTSISQQTVALLDDHLLTPTALSTQEQAALRQRFDMLLEHVQLPAEHTPQLLFRSSQEIGANAFALPDGTVILLDDLVRTANNHNQVASVLAHEIGHISHRHGLRSVLQASLIGLGVAIIDITSVSTLASSLPIVLVQSGYSRDFERQADEFALDLMKKTNIPPSAFIDLMQKIDPRGSQSDAINFVATHPPTKERIKQFKQASEQ